MSFGARARIRLGALSHNLAEIRARAPNAAVMAVVKANAYGHGLTAVAKALGDVDSFAVARLSEAQELRHAGIRQPVVLLSGVYSGDELQQAVAANCEIVVHSARQIEMLEDRADIRTTAWLKFDTGMNRLGFSCADAPALMERAQRCPAIQELRLMTHLANADNRQDAGTGDQLMQFAEIAGTFSGDISIANSGGIFGWPQASMPDYSSGNSRVWIRPGISLYGVSPFPETDGSALGLQPVMQFESRLVAIKPIAKGDRVGYGGTWRAPRDSMLGIVSAGYGDGYTRSLTSGTPVLVNGRIVPLAGVVSMDLAAVDLGPTIDDRIGDAVVLWGDGLPVEEIARHSGLLAYQLVCGVTHRERSEVEDLWERL